MSIRTISVAAAILGAIAVILGALGAHALRTVLSPEKLANWQTAASYQFIHVLAMLAVGILGRALEAAAAKWLRAAGTCLFAGVLCFSGSLYLLVLREMIGLPDGLVRVLGPITPIGGLLFIAGWGLLALHLARGKTFID